MELGLPPLQIRLLQDSARLPATIGIQFPLDVALSILRRRLAIPVADLNNVPDLIVDEDDMKHVGFDLWNPVVEASA